MIKLFFFFLYYSILYRCIYYESMDGLIFVKEYFQLPHFCISYFHFFLSYYILLNILYLLYFYLPLSPVAFTITSSTKTDFVVVLIVRKV